MTLTVAPAGIPGYGTFGAVHVASVSTQVPAWATAVPFAPVLQPPAKAFQIAGLTDQEVQALRQQLQQAIWQAFLQIVDGFLLPIEPAVQLAQWWEGLVADVAALLPITTWTTFLTNAIAALGGSGSLLATLVTLLRTIPFGNITSILGGLNLGADIQAIVDKLVNGLGVGGTNHTLAALLAAIEAIPSANLTAILGGANLGADIQAIVDTGVNALIGGSSTGNPLATFGAVLKAINPGLVAGMGGPATLSATLQRTWDTWFQNLTGLSTTGNSIANVGNALNTAIAMLNTHDTVLNSTVLAQATGGSGGGTPTTQQFTASGTYTVPSFMASGDKFDVIVLGDGGGGRYSFTPNNPGDGGTAGAWTAITLTWGTSMPLATTTFTVTVGSGGAGGTSGGVNGGNGTGSSVAMTGHATITAAGGTGGTSLHAAGLNDWYGASPGVEIFNSISYSGGGQQTVAQQNGVAPGGGGSGGQYAWFLNSGGAGAPGSVWVRAYKATSPAIAGSGFRQYRVSTTQVALASHPTGTLLPNSFFDTNQWLSADLTSAPATANKLSVSVAGWYHVTICLLISSPPAAGSIQPVLYQNGSVAQAGGFGPYGNTGVAVGTFIVYCAATDYLQPGYQTGVASGDIAGEATGTQCYWSVMLANRSLA